MRIINAEIEKFAEFLLDLELVGKKSRLRTRFIKVLKNRLELINEEYSSIIQEHANKDEKGEPIFEEKDGSRFYDVKDKNALANDYKELMLEEFVIDQNEERKDMLLTIQDVVLNCEKMFKGKEALEYDRFCEIVEEISY